MKLKKKSVAKPWGQSVLPQVFGGERKQKTGEIWFQPPKGIKPALMVKYLFTSEKLSIQVHPNDRQAQRNGLPHGKDECWYILDATPDAVLGIGLTKKVSPTKLRAAVLCGQMEQLIDWKPVKAGDFFYIPAGTIHAIGPGVTLVEAQQNVDVTYRLYDYGRPRELHLDEALTVAKPEPYDMKHHVVIDSGISSILLDGPHFRMFHIVGNNVELLGRKAASEWQVVPLEGKATVRNKQVAPGDCGLCPGLSDIDLSKNERSLIVCNMK